MTILDPDTTELKARFITARLAGQSGAVLSNPLKITSWPI
jgi:hypothetical protein